MFVGYVKDGLNKTFLGINKNKKNTLTLIIYLFILILRISYPIIWENKKNQFNNIKEWYRKGIYNIFIVTVNWIFFIIEMIKVNKISTRQSLMF